MSAKPARQRVSSPAPAQAASASEAQTAGDGSWLDSTDPRKRLWGQIVFVAVWLYVAALWLLALDQSFHWGIFGPKLPPMP